MSVTAVLTPQSSIQAGNRNVFPLIADDSFDRIGSGAIAAEYSSHDGLLASSDISAALLSMSDYSKAAYSDAKDYHTTEPLQQAMYVAYPQPGSVQPHLQSPHASSYARHATPVSYAAGNLFNNRPTRNEESGTYLPDGSREIAQVQSWSPQQGPRGSRVFIFLVSAFELDPSWRLEVEFGSRKCATTQRKLDPQSSYHQYALSTEVPEFSLTGYVSQQVPVRIVAQNQSGNEIESIKLSPAFIYTDSSISQHPSDLPKKRRLSDESAEIGAAPLKRPTAHHGRTESNESYQSQGYNYLPQNNPPYLQGSPHLALDTSSIGNVLPAYQRAQTHSSDSPQDSPQRIPQQISSATPTSAPVRGRSPQTPSWNVSNPTGGHIPRSPGVALSSNSRVATLASPSMLSNPPLIRTSTLQQSPSPASTPSGASAPGNFNPYAMYPHKAILKINGSLDSMTEDWREEERDFKRRLVQFWRSQTGSTITTDFKPVAPEDRQPNSICISCIWWESRNEYYVTSVDTIYLLESLVDVRFTVEEKNRIRRNLEGFRPMTVSKGKSDSEDFFKLIMGFPNPKPRNIEKDVKVFPWKILSHALKKIISKYSASYSSTSGPLTTTINPSFRAPQPQDLGGELLPASPHSTAESSMGIAYPPPLTATTMSSANEVPLAQTTSPYASASPAIMPTTMAPVYPLYSYPQAHLHHTASTMSLAAQQPPQHQRPPSWEFAAFIEPTSVANGSSLYAGDPSQNAGQYQMTHTSSGA